MDRRKSICIIWPNPPPSPSNNGKTFHFLPAKTEEETLGANKLCQKSIWDFSRLVGGAAESGIHLMIEALPASSPNEPRHETKFIPYCPKSDLAISRGTFNSIIMF